MDSRCYIHGPTTTAGTCPTCDAMQREDNAITRLRDENVELKSQIVMECNEDEIPTFNQGLIEHELLEVVTAKRLDTLVALVVSLRARLEEAETAKADAWYEGYNSGRLDEMTDERMRSNPYRSKTDEPQ